MNLKNGKKRIVVKIGTSTLTHDTGKANISLIAKLASVLSDLKNEGHQKDPPGPSAFRLRRLWGRAN